MGEASRCGWFPLVMIMACGGTPSSTAASPSGIHVPYEHLDREHTAVVHISSDCSGTLVGARHVLTAGHCVTGEHDLRVEIRGRHERIQRHAFQCELHPNAFGAGERPRPCSVERRLPLRAWDLALLELGRDVPTNVASPHPIAFRSPARLERVQLVGWFRHPFAIGAPRRYAGWNRVVGDERGLLHTLPEGEPPFSTRMGSSGGPALAGDRVVGVLFGGEAADSADSIYVQTYTPDTARWLRRKLM